MFSGVCWNQPVCPSVSVSVCVQNTSFCQSAGGGIKSNLVTVYFTWLFSYIFYIVSYMFTIFIREKVKEKYCSNIQTIIYQPLEYKHKDSF